MAPIKGKTITCSGCGTELRLRIWDLKPEGHDCNGVRVTHIPEPSNVVPKAHGHQFQEPKVKGKCPGCFRAMAIMKDGTIRGHTNQFVVGPVDRTYPWRLGRCESGGPPLEILPALELIAALCDDEA